MRIMHRSALAYLKKKAKEQDLNFKARNARRVLSNLSEELSVKKDLKISVVSRIFSILFML